MKNVTSIVLSAAIASGMTIATFKWMNEPQKGIPVQDSSKTNLPVHSASYYTKAASLDFTQASEKVMPAVVHIKSVQRAERNPYSNRRIDPFREFFGYPPQQGQENRRQESSGSGVVINKDGYIVTNNHVIDGAEEIEVSLHDNRTYQATLVGRDPSTDLALLKIEENELEHISLVDSDEVQVGEWVLAVGNPFNLNSTVTSGIVSAKARNINILKDRSAIESFIQTDAAVNPGNSGGALVNLDGQLIGINTAIASNTGSFAGYSFAIPSNIVSKVVEDILKYGVVQRGFLGVTIREVDGALAEQETLDVTEGVYVNGFMEGSAAESAGIEKGDVIVQVDGHPVGSAPELQEMIGRKRPGDATKIVVNRQGRKKSFDVVLNNKDGNTEIIKKEAVAVLSVLGGEFENLSEKDAERYDVDGGIQLKSLTPGKLSDETSVREGFVITHIAGKRVKDIKDMTKALNGVEGGVMIEGFYPNRRGTYYYAIGM